MPSERDIEIAPVVGESVMHNTKTISNLRNITSSLFGVAAGVLGLESYTGFLFYLICTTFVSAMVYVLRTQSRPHEYFQNTFTELWLGEMLGGLSGYVLTWTLLYGLVRA